MQPKHNILIYIYILDVCTTTSRNKAGRYTSLVVRQWMNQPQNVCAVCSAHICLRMNLHMSSPSVCAWKFWWRSWWCWWWSSFASKCVGMYIWLCVVDHCVWFVKHILRDRECDLEVRHIRRRRAIGSSDRKNRARRTQYTHIQLDLVLKSLPFSQANPTLLMLASETYGICDGDGARDWLIRDECSEASVKLAQQVWDPRSRIIIIPRQQRLSRRLILRLLLPGILYPFLCVNRFFCRFVGNCFSGSLSLYIVA